MAKVQNGEEMLPKVSTSLSRAHERYRQTDSYDRQTEKQTTDGFAIAKTQT